MAYEHKPNTGSIFKNDRKEEETHADYKGDVLIDGVQYWVDAYINRPEGKKPFMALKFRPKDGARPSGGAKQTKFVQDDEPF
jgi:hypothetical protein